MGERHMSLAYNHNTNMWEGELNKPVSTNVRLKGRPSTWWMALKSWTLPNMRGDTKLHPLVIRLMNPRCTDASLWTAVHTRSQLSSGNSPLLRWHRLESGVVHNTEIRDIALIITTCGTEQFAPATADLRAHLTLEIHRVDAEWPGPDPLEDEEL
jgi:hypothetical protein